MRSTLPMVIGIVLKVENSLPIISIVNQEVHGRETLYIVEHVLARQDLMSFDSFAF
jgi:hypothetical protein